MKYELLYNFISPVTGRILSPPDYVPYGDRSGIATPSPIITDIRLDLINLRASTFIIGFDDSSLPNAQALNLLPDGFIYNNGGIISIDTIPLPPDTLPLPVCYAGTTPLDILIAIYDNGISGIGATLTAVSIGFFSVDGTSPSLGTYILVKDRTNAFENGIYIVTTNNSLSFYILTRVTFYDEPGEINPGDSVSIQNGTINAKATWIQLNIVNIIGTDSIQFIGPMGSGFNNLPSFSAQYNLYTGGTLIGSTYPAIETTQIQLLNLPSFVDYPFPNSNNPGFWISDKNGNPTEYLVDLPPIYAATTAGNVNIVEFASYNNGPTNNGIGATLTGIIFQDLIIDGITTSSTTLTNKYILVKDRGIFSGTYSYENGIYQVTDEGSLFGNFILTRATFYDEVHQIKQGGLVPIGNNDNLGTVNNGSIWILMNGVNTIGTDDIIYNYFGALPSQITGLQNQITTINGEISTINGEISSLNAEIVIINGEILVIDATLTTLTTGLAAVTGAEATLSLFVSLISLNNMPSSPTGPANVDFNSHKGINVTDPTNAQDAATKNYVDNAISSSITTNRAYCSLIMSGNSTVTTIITTGNYVKVAGTTTTVISNNFSSSSTPSNRMIYTGTINANLLVTTTITFRQIGLGSTEVYFRIYKNGTSISIYTIPIGTIAFNGINTSITFNTIIPVVTNDYLEIFVTTIIGISSLIIEELNFTAVLL